MSNRPSTGRARRQYLIRNDQRIANAFSRNRIRKAAGTGRGGRRKRGLNCHARPYPQRCRSGVGTRRDHAFPERSGRRRPERLRGEWRWPAARRHVRASAPSPLASQAIRHGLEVVFGLQAILLVDFSEVAPSRGWLRSGIRLRAQVRKSGTDDAHQCVFCPRQFTKGQRRLDNAVRLGVAAQRDQKVLQRYRVLQIGSRRRPRAVVP